MSHNSTQSTFTVNPALWQTDRSALKSIREQVFIQEQGVPEALEWDGADDSAIHLLAEDGEGHAIGTARLLADGHIGRVAVLRQWRGRGVGTALMHAIISVARGQGHTAVFLDAQLEAMGFYHRLGFIAEGEVFMDAGIPHRHMRLTLDT